MKKLSWFFGIVLLATLATGVTAQTGPTGRIRGTVVDAASGQPLPYAALTAPDAGSSVGTTTDEQGAFTLPPLPVGRHTVQAWFVGYEPAIVREVMVSSAKETVLQIALKENVQRIEEVVVRPRINKEAPINPMALAGARMLSVEEASRYAGGLDDPARLATAFAGTAGDVTNNSIAIRGNSPQFLQWKLEEVEIPNPSHYPEIGAVGGGVLTAFSSQVLGNSDFFTGAFPAQYGNALSGVFDMMLRSGNNQQHEHTAQLGTLGVEFGSEGPFKKGGLGSYLFNYRYSSLALAGDVMGGSMEEVAGARYQDLSFKINLPTRKAGTFTLWGIGTNDKMSSPLPDDLSSYEYLPTTDGTRQYMGAAGLGHRIFLGANTYLKTTLAATHAYNHIWQDIHRDDRPELEQIGDMRDKSTHLIFNSYLNTKFSARHTNRTGVTLTGIFYDDDYNLAPGFPYPEGPIANFVDSDGSSGLVSAFTQSLFQFSERLAGEIGVNGQYFALNGRWTVEPRASLRWKAAPRHAIGIAAGMHSRHERLDYYFITTPETGDRLVNKDLDFAKAYHATLSYDWNISDNIHLRVEPYFQYLYDVPVVPGTGRSIINQFDFWMTDPLVNNGKGRNFGVDLTLERYLKEGFYYMLTASVFDSEYTGDDGVWHNTRYNRRFLANALGGKEWVLGRNKQKVLGINLRLNVMGGSRYTPLDQAASLAAERPIEDESRLMEEQNPTALILHVTVKYQIHRPKVTHEFGAMMLNITGNKDYYGFDYNFATHRMDHMTSTVGIPNIYYRISF